MKRLFFRLLVINVLLVFLPIVSVFYLDTFERQLLARLERSMVQEGRVFAAALAGGDVGGEALRIMINLAGRVESRIRVLDSSGRVLADSAVDSAPVENSSSGNRTTTSARDEVLYRTLVPPARRVLDALSPPEPPLPAAEFYGDTSLLDGPEIAAALDGRYGAATRVSPGGQRSVTLYSAIPIVDSSGVVTGAVLVSRSTFRILDDLYQLRLDIIRIFVYSVLVAIAVNALLSLTITRPLRKLRDRSEQLLMPERDLRTSIRTGFPALRRRDEIGDLSRSLRELWNRLASQIAVMDDFSADILHEVKNPLAAIRSSAEVIGAELSGERPLTTDEMAEVTPFVDAVLNESGRIDRLLGELREITQLDAHLQWEETQRVPIGPFIDEVATLYQTRAADGGISIRRTTSARCTDVALNVNRDRLYQLVGNILDNALDFAAASVWIDLDCADNCVVLTISDDGAGIPSGSLPKVFDRFFTERDTRADHDGLGLAVCKSIADGYGGSLVARSEPSSAASGKSGPTTHFVLTLPLCA